MATDLQIELRSEPRLLRAVRGMVRAYIASYGFDADRQDEVVLAVDEACANALRHSYQGDPSGIVRLRFDAEADWVQIELSDDGVPCPQEKTRPRVQDTAPNIEDLVPGGLGIGLIHEVFDEVAFAPGADRGNRVTMRLRRPCEQVTEHGA